MSSIDQAFVKAFARRNRSSQSMSTAASHESSTAPNLPPAVPSAPRVPLASTETQNDFLKVDPAVRSSVEVFSDPHENRLVRVDSLDRDPVPAPHAVPQQQTPDPRKPGDAASSENGSASERVAPSVQPIQAPASPPQPIVEQPYFINREADSPHDHVRSIQASLDLLQHSFTTLESPVEDLPHPYSDGSIVSATPTQLDPPMSTQPLSSPRIDRDPVEVSEVVQRRIDPAVVHPTAPENTAAPVFDDSEAVESQTPDFGLATASAESQYMRPVWEVDVFDVPTAVADLFFEGPLFQQVAERVLQAVQSGLASIMVTSVRRGEGRSTVAIGMAMAAAAAGLRVALVDADTEEPTLLDDLRLELEYGWVDTVRGRLPIREVAVHAVEDGVTFIPLIPPHTGSAATEYEVVQLLQSLRGKFDLVVVDTPSLDSASTHPAATTIDSALIVRDASRTGTDAVNKLSYHLREKGVQGVGVVENFT